MGIRLRFLGILMILFVATHFDFQSSTFRFESPTGVCEEAYSPERGFYCTEDSVILQRPIFERFIDLPTIFVVWGFTFLVVYTRRPENSVDFWEETSHVAKDAGELAAALGSVLAFTGVFNERTMSIAFSIVFLGYFTGHLTGMCCKAYAMHLRRKQEEFG